MKLQLLAAWRFVALSGLSFAANLGLTVFLHEVLRVREELAFAIVLSFTTVMNFLLMRSFVYPGGEAGFLKQFGLFAGSSLGFRGLEYILFLIFHSWIGLAYRPVIVGTLTATFACKFFYYGTVVFSRPARGRAAASPAGPGIALP